MCVIRVDCSYYNNLIELSIYIKEFFLSLIKVNRNKKALGMMKMMMKRKIFKYVNEAHR